MRTSIVHSYMPRIGRIQSGTGIYHVMLRGINRQDLFEEPDDYWAFIRVLSALPQRKSVVTSFPVCTCHIYAYCLMPNHVHLLVCEKDWKVGEIVKFHQNPVKAGLVDEAIRQMILEKSGTKNLTEFRLHSKERQKNIIRDVMLKLDAGSRQLSRVSGLPYSIVYKLKKL